MAIQQWLAPLSLRSWCITAKYRKKIVDSKLGVRSCQQETWEHASWGGRSRIDRLLSTVMMIIGPFGLRKSNCPGSKNSSILVSWLSTDKSMQHQCNVDTILDCHGQAYNLPVGLFPNPQRSQWCKQPRQLFFTLKERVTNSENVEGTQSRTSAPSLLKEPVEMVQASNQDAPRYISLEVFWAYPTERRLQGRQRTCWWECICHQTWQCLSDPTGLAAGHG